MSSYLSSLWSFFTSSHLSPTLATYSIVEVATETYVCPEVVVRDGGLILHRVTPNASTVDYNLVLLKGTKTFR